MTKCKICGKEYEPALNKYGSLLNPNFCEKCLEIPE